MTPLERIALGAEKCPKYKSHKLFEPYLVVETQDDTVFISEVSDSVVEVSFIGFAESEYYTIPQAIAIFLGD